MIRACLRTISVVEATNSAVAIGLDAGFFGGML